VPYALNVVGSTSEVIVLLGMNAVVDMGADSGAGGYDSACGKMRS
jgi:hypothetical protein